MRDKYTYNPNGKKRAKKERIIMIASSVFVLAALTMTGVYVKSNSEKQKNDGYQIDFDALEKEDGNGVHEKYEEIKEQIEGSLKNGDKQSADIENSIGNVADDDLDYLPMEQAGSDTVINPSISGGDSVSDSNALSLQEEAMLEGLEDQEAMERDAQNGKNIEDSQNEKGKEKKDTGYVAGNALVWPVSGNVLIPYSMDKTVFHATLSQYKYSPAMILAATEGDCITAAAGGEVIDISYDEEIGSGVTVSIGGGYEVVYAQLKDIKVKKGDTVGKGEIIGYVASPTKYFSVEGANAYFALTKDGEPTDPLAPLQ